MSHEFGLIAADTSRSRAYLAAMERRGLLPAWVLLLDAETPAGMPGQAAVEAAEAVADAAWPEANFDLAAPLRPWVERLGLSYEVSDSRDINDPVVVALIARASQQVLVYSGYGGVLLRDAVLATGKRFLHAHGGYLPNFKGSTTNYFSLLVEGSIGVSTIFLAAEIDCGPVIRRRRFAPPALRARIDHVYDSAARARVLVDTLEAWRRAGDWTFELPDNTGGDVYYIIHPVLKHLAILGGSEQTAGRTFPQNPRLQIR
jgi:methionyl-tRNA formyltransferase